jgi:DNA-binding CsgD family transcriptional regulator
VPLDREIPTRVILSHENITPLVEAKEELQRRTTQLEERNIALKVLLEQRPNDRKELEESLVLNVHREVMPYLERLIECLPAGEAIGLAELARKRLLDIFNPLLRRLENNGIILTTQEARTAQLIRDGKSNKEIAALLYVSSETVQFHRKNIRRKLGLTKRGESLRAFLLRQAER